LLELSKDVEKVPTAQQTCNNKTKMSSSVEISAGDLDFFLNFLQTEGIDEFDFSVKEDEDLVNSFYYFLKDQWRKWVKF